MQKTERKVERKLLPKVPSPEILNSPYNLQTCEVPACPADRPGGQYYLFVLVMSKDIELIRLRTVVA